MTWPTGKPGNLTSGFLMEHTTELPGHQSYYLCISECAAELVLTSVQTAAICCGNIKISLFLSVLVVGLCGSGKRLSTSKNVVFTYRLRFFTVQRSEGHSSHGTVGGEVDLSGIKCNHFIIWWH